MARRHTKRIVKNGWNRDDYEPLFHFCFGGTEGQTLCPTLSISLKFFTARSTTSNVALSVSLPFSSNFSCACVISTSLCAGGSTLADIPGALNMRRRSMCARIVRMRLMEAPTTITGLPIIGLSPRDSQSKLFLSTPGTDQLYSGVEMSTPSYSAI